MIGSIPDEGYRQAVPTLPTPPRVDVGVVTWNTAELTATALRRLLDGDQGCELKAT